METVDFYPATFSEIQAQDNPAFGNDECLMVVAEEGSDHAIVLHIVPNPIEAVTHLAKFWRHDKALEYCEFVTSNVKVTGAAPGKETNHA